MSVCLGRIGIIPPGHIRDPGDVDRVSLGACIQGLIASTIIERLTLCPDACVAARGLVHKIVVLYMSVFQKQSREQRIIASVYDETYHGTGLIITKVRSQCARKEGTDGDERFGCREKACRGARGDADASERGATLNSSRIAVVW